MFTHLLSLQAKCGVEDGAHMIGGSVIVAPSGEIVARARSEEDEVIAAEVDLAMADRFRQTVFNFAEHRQPHTYRLIVERLGRDEPLPTLEPDESAIMV